MAMRRSHLPTLAVVLLLLAVACSPDAGEPATPTAAAEAAVADPSVRPDKLPLVEGPVSPDGLKAILGTGDLAVGRNRVGFVLTSRDGFVTEPAATVSSRYYDISGSEGDPGESVEAAYHPWPYGNRGLYAVWMEFDQAGSWGVDIAVAGPDGQVRTAQLFFEVAASLSAPAVGTPAIKSVTRTVKDVETLAQLTTGSMHDEELYQATIAEAVSSGRPTVIVFASPAFCTNAVCGPQVEVLRQLKEKYRGVANFIHVDFYDNPDEIQGDLSRSRLSPSVLEWGLPSIEWSFVVDARGVVSARFEAFATFKEVEEELRRVL
jgi:hypothetical protein